MTNTLQKNIFLALKIGILGFFLVFSHTVQASEMTPGGVIDLVNEARLSHKQSILTVNDRLTRAAQLKAEDMFAQGYFAHTSPEGKTPWTWFEKAGYDYEYAGENLAIHFVSVEDQQRAWMESPTHRKNILNSHYREIGVAVVKGTLEGRETIVTVQEFGSVRGGIVMENAEVSSGEGIPAISPSVGVAENESVLIPAEPSFLEYNRNRAYESVLMLFWGVMIAQVLIVGYMIMRQSRPSTLRISTLVSHHMDDREYKIPVRIETLKHFQ